jgi:hypothetical protein
MQHSPGGQPFPVSRSHGSNLKHAPSENVYTHLVAPPPFATTKHMHVCAVLQKCAASHGCCGPQRAS